MSYDTNLESKRQSLASRLVEREVYCCVSSLMSDLASFEKGEYYDEVMDAFYVEDFQEALEQYIANADIDELESLIEENGYWSDFVDEHVKPPVFIPAEGDDDPDHWSVDGEHFDDEDDAREKAIELALPLLRDKARDHVSELCGDDPRDLCDALNIDWHDREVYEHWAVSGWLGRKLNEQGEKTLELYGMTVWCRCTTGQSICLDRVIQEIACELWDDELGSKDDGREDTV